MFFQPLWISSFMEQENKSLSLLGLYSGSHFHRTSVKSYPVLVTNVLKNKDFIDVTLADEDVYTKVANIKVGAEESLRNSSLIAWQQLDNTIFRVRQRIGLFCQSLDLAFPKLVVMFYC